MDTLHMRYYASILSLLVVYTGRVDADKVAAHIICGDRHG